MTQLRLSDFNNIQEFFEARQTERRGYSLKHAWSASIVIISILLALFLVVFCVTCNRARAEQSISIKGGYMHQFCEAVEDNSVISVGLETKTKWLGLEIELEAFAPNIPQVNRLYATTASLIPKIYLWNFYLGPKVGYIFTTVKNMDADDEVVRGGVIGYLFKNNWFIEFQRLQADLDIETFLPYETNIEKHSRLDNWQILVGKKWKF